MKRKLRKMKKVRKSYHIHLLLIKYVIFQLSFKCKKHDLVQLNVISRNKKFLRLNVHLFYNFLNNYLYEKVR